MSINTDHTDTLGSHDRDRNAWRWGFTPQAEIWNGRLAMIGFSSALLIEIFTGQIKFPF